MSDQPNPQQPLPNTFTDLATGRRINLLDWKAANIRYSWMLALVTFALLAAIAYLIAIAIDPSQAVFFIVIALLIAGTQNAIAYWFSDQLALRVSGAKPANSNQHRYLINVTEAVAIGAGVPMPDVYVIDSPAPNAFATGRNPDKSAVAVTQGLIDLLDRQELEGVIAHEMAHIRNYDILFSSMLAATVGAIIVLRDIILRAMRYGSGRSRRNDSGSGQAQAIAYVILIVLLIIAPILATLLRMAVSRRREFLADATGAYITRNPEGLARALEKLQAYKGQALQVSEGVQHMYFSNPQQHLNANTLLATHPPLEERIQRLRRM